MKLFGMNKKEAIHFDHLLGIDHITEEDIINILDLADFYATKIEADKNYQNDALKKARILNLFFENSTRTRASFDMAARRLGAEPINLDIATSSVKKGETLMDTVHTMNQIILPDAIVMRHSEYGAPGYVASQVNIPVINAGDAHREHPTQALLDALTIMRTKGGITGRTITICGDIAHSRVARSNIILLRKLGANIRVIAPAHLMPQDIESGDIRYFDSMEAGLEGSDIIMMLRLQKERMQSGMISSDEDYFKQYGLTTERLNLASKDALVMHPGPINRNVEIADDVADDVDRSLILKQVFLGIPTRMAIMELLVNQDRSH